MAALGLLHWSRLVWPGALVALVAAGCGESSTSDPDVAAGKGGSAGSAAGSGGASAGTTGGSRSGSSGSAGTTATGGRGSAGTAGTAGRAGNGGTAGTAGTENTGGVGDGAGGADTGGTGGSSGSGAGTGGAPDIPINQMCETFEPCGGDPEGSWTVVDTCLEVPGEIAFLDIPGCEDAVEGVGMEVMGTRTFENGEVSFEQTSTARVAVFVSDACAQAVLMSAQEVDANQLCPLLPNLVALNMDSPFSDVACSLVDDECHCDLFMNVEMTTTTTTYVVEGNHITQGDGQEYDFCQEGDSLILHGLQESGSGDAVDELTVEYARD